MNTITKKMLLISFMLPCACAHYPQQYAYYPSNAAYSSGYTIMHRNYYGERPDHYNNSYRQGNAYFPHHYRHDQYRGQPRQDDDHREPRHHDHGGYDRAFNYGNNRQHNDSDDNHRNSFDRRNHH